MKNTYMTIMSCVSFVIISKEMYNIGYYQLIKLLIITNYCLKNLLV